MVQGRKHAKAKRISVSHITGLLLLFGLCYYLNGGVRVYIGHFVLLKHIKIEVLWVVKCDTSIKENLKV